MSSFERRSWTRGDVGTYNQKRTRIIEDEMNRAFPPLSKKVRRSLREKGKGGSPGDTKDSSEELGSPHDLRFIPGDPIPTPYPIAPSNPVKVKEVA